MAFLLVTPQVPEVPEQRADPVRKAGVLLLDRVGQRGTNVVVLHFEMVQQLDLVRAVQVRGLFVDQGNDPLRVRALGHWCLSPRLELRRRELVDCLEHREPRLLERSTCRTRLWSTNAVS